MPYLLPGYNLRLLQTVGWYPVMVPLVALIYWIGIKAYFSQRPAQQPLKSKSPLPAAAINQLLGLLNETMQTDLLYLDPHLQLQKVAVHTRVRAKFISAALNQHRHQSFNQWVNGYRVEAFKQRLAANDQVHLTLAGIARECGFNSPATFQRIFKQLTGMVPTEYCNHMAAQKEHSNPDLGATGLPS